MPPVAVVVLTWSAFGLLLYGVGAAVARAVRPAEVERVDIRTQFWLGWGGTIAVLQLWHLLLPVDTRVLFVLVPVSLFGWIRRPLRSWPGPVSLLGMAVTVLWAAMRSTRAPTNPDVCLYLEQTVRWFHHSAVVPGLANLNLRLGFNHAYFLFPSLVESVVPDHLGSRLANGVMILATILPAIPTLVDLCQPKRTYRLSQFLEVGLAAVLLDEVISGNLTSPSADATINAGGMAMVLWVIDGALDGAAATPFRLRVTGLLGCVLIVAKPNAFLFALPLLAYQAIHTWHLERSWTQWRGTVLAALIIGLVVAIPWVVTGWIVSGYPLFPLEIGRLGLPWQLPGEFLRTERLYEKAFARLRTKADFLHTSDYSWVVAWWENQWPNNRTFFIPFVELVLGSGAALALAWRRRRPISDAWLMVPLLVGLAAWWELAPATRFAQCLLWSAGHLAVLLAFKTATNGTTSSTARASLLLCVLLLAFGAFIGGGKQLAWPHEFPPGPVQKTTSQHLASGEPIPVSDGCCLDPDCVVGDARDIKTRVPGDFTRGFVLVR